MYRKYDFNENYFNELKTHEQAYILGFIYADGYNREDMLELDQKEERLDILENINKALKSNYPIKSYSPGIYRLCFSSKKLCSNLTKLGAVRNKSLILTFPKFIPDELMSSFILGYFDGDGCVWNGKRKKMWVKNEKKPGEMRERIVHNVKFTFTGNFEFINSLQDFLIKKGVVSKKTKLNFSKARNPNTPTSDNVCTMEYSGRKQMRSLYEYMYSNSPIWCNEKKSKFEEIFCASEERSSEDTSLIAGTPEMVISSQASDNKSVEGSSTIPEMGVESSDSKCEAPNSNEKDEDIVSSAVK
jgi:hypothetical protein